MLYLSWLLPGSGRYGCPEVDGGSSGANGWGDMWGEGRSGDDNPGLGRVRRVWGSSPVRVVGRAGWHLAWMAPDGSRSSHGSGLVGDLVHNGLHELRREARNLDGSGP